MSASMRSVPVIVRDPVHGDIEITREELRLIDTAPCTPWPLVIGRAALPLTGIASTCRVVRMDSAA